MKQNYKIPKQVIWLILFICILPLLLNIIGVDFGSPNGNLDPLALAQLDKIDQQNELHHLLRGRFIQTILVGLSVSIAFLTIILAFVDFRIKSDITTPIVGMALLCAGLLDFFRISVALEIFTITGEQQFIGSFIWFFSRNFHALILILGVSIFLLKPKINSKEIQKKDKRFIFYNSLIFFLLTILISIFIVNVEIPEMIFPNSIIPRPFDLFPLLIYIVAGTVIFPQFYRKYPSPFSQMLVLSLVPAIVTQLHMAFGSRELFDNHFNIAHFMVSVTYLVPFIGICYNYIQTHKSEQEVIDHLSEEVAERIHAEQTLKGVLNSSLSGIMVFKSVRNKENKIIDFEWTLANPASGGIAGVEANSLIGKKLLENYPRNKVQVFDKYVNVVETGIPMNYEFFSHWLKKWIHIVAVKLEDGFAETFEDISDRKKAEEELLESRHFNQQIADATPDIIYLFDYATPRIDYINKTVTDVLGFTPEEIYFQGPALVTLLTDVEDHDKLVNYVKDFSTASDGEIRELEFLIKDNTGQCKWLKTRNTVFKRNGKGNPSQIIGIAQDITKRKEAEEKLRKNEALLSEAQKLAHCGSWEWDITNDLVTWTDELCRIFGYDPFEVSGNCQVYKKHLYPEDWQVLSEKIQESLHTKESFSFEHRLIQKNRSERILLTQCKVLADEEGNALKILGSALDITEQKKTMENTLKSEGLYRTMAKNMPNSAVLLFDHNFTLTLADGTAIEVLDPRSRDIIGKNMREIYDKDQYEFLFPLYNNAFKGQESIFEREINGRYYKIQIMPVKNSEEVTFACMSVFQDITEIKHSQQELELRIEELNRSNVELEQFAYVASHDLQEPLRKIRAFGDRLLGKFNEQLGDDGQNYIGRMQNAASRMQILIDDLLTFSRLSRSKDSYAKTDLTLIIEEVLSDLEFSIEQKNATFIIDELPNIEVVPGQIRQLFQNLISNALKFTRDTEPPVITIKSEMITGKDIKGINKNFRNHKYFNISIQDNGIGFEEKYLDRIFVIFQRLHGRNEYNGTGIGLAVCKKILENHNGFITAQSVVNEGSKFIITLPVKQKYNVQLALPFIQLQNEEIS